MRAFIPLRLPLLALLASSISACSNMDSPSRFTQLRSPAHSFSATSERLRDEVREYLKEEDRWIPRGRDISLWQSAEMLSASGRNLTEGFTRNRITNEEMGELVGSATRRFKNVEFWTANVRINEAIQKSLGEVRISLSAVQRNSRVTATAQSTSRDQPSVFIPRGQPALRRTDRSTSFFASSAEPFSPNDLNGAVGIAKAYLQHKYGIKREAFGNMRARELSNRHEVTLEVNKTGYILMVDIRRGAVVSEKTYPKAGHGFTASR